MDKYEVLGMVGEGSFGKVYKAKTRANDDIVAFKIIPKRGRSQKELKSLRQEFEIQQNLNHPNIIRMLDSFETDHEIVVVTQYAPKSLSDVLSKEAYFKEDQVQKIVCDLVSALYYLHSNRVLHRDLKPQNILLEANGTAKLCDFGFARSMSTGTHVLTSIKGTPLYMAPELIDESPYDHNADLWSLGCIAHELLVGSPPFLTSSILRLVRLISYEPIKLPNFLSSTCHSFLLGLLQKDPTQRLTWPALLDHPFVAGRVLILDSHTGFNSVSTPLTHPLTASQLLAKENQKKYLSSRTAGNARALALAVKQIEEQEHDQKHKMLEGNNRHQGVRDASTSPSHDDKHCISGDHSTTCVLQNHSTNNTASSCVALVQNTQKCAQNSLNDSAVSTKNTVKREVKTSEIGTQASQSSCNPSLPHVDHVTHELSALNLDEAIGHRRVKENTIETTVKPSKVLPMNRGGIKDFPKGGIEARQNEGVFVKNHSKLTLNSWMSEDDPQPIECDEWLVFLQRTMEEVMEGEVEEMKQENFVAVMVAPLRNPNASSRVLEYVACLLSLPFVVSGVTNDELSTIKQVYLEVKAVPNLVYASKLLARQRGFDCDLDQQSKTRTNNSDQNLLRPVSDLRPDELQALECIYLLLCHLVYVEEDFLAQFCDAVVILNGVQLLQQFMLLGHRKVRVVADLLAILTHILRVLPENASLVEQIVLGSGQNKTDTSTGDLSRLLTHHNPILRSRSCLLVRLLGRYSCRALQSAWTPHIRYELEKLLEDSDDVVQAAADEAVNELKELSFYESQLSPKR